MKELIKEYGVKVAPSKTLRHGIWVECVIPIGNDEVAYLTMTDEAYKKLMGERFNG